jgi:PAS domain S-box-containing protein
MDLINEGMSDDSVPDPYHRILASFPNGVIAVLDRDLRYRLAEGLGLAQAGLASDALMGRHLAEVLPVDLIGPVESYIRRSFAGEEVVFDLPCGSSTYEVRSAPFERNGETVATILAVANDVTLARAAETRQRILEEASEVLASSLDIEATFGEVARLVVPTLADWCVMHLLEDDGQLQRIAMAHADPSKDRLIHEMVESYPFKREAAFGPARVLRTGEGEFYTEATSEVVEAVLANLAIDERQLEMYRRLGATASIVMPIVNRNQVVGTISLSVDDPRPRYLEDIRALAEGLARRVSLAAENARLYRVVQQELAERKRAEEGQRLRQIALTRLATSDVVGIVTVEENRIVEANEVFLHMVDYTTDDLEAGLLDWRALTPPEYLPLAEHASAEMLSTGSTTPFEKEYFRQDGSRVPVLIGAALLEREPMRWVCFIVDLSARQALVESYQQTMEHIAHDLKNAISTMHWSAQLMQRRAGEGLLTEEDLHGGFRSIVAGATRMTTIVNGLLDAALLRQGAALDLDLDSIDLVALVERRVDAYSPTTDRHRFRLETFEAPLVGTWDELRLERVVDNFLSNAIKYSPSGMITLTVARERRDEREWAVVSIRDEGIGIPAIELPTIFDRFRRGANAIAQASGSGMGLASAKQIVEQHGGMIGVKSQVGVGSTFTVRLPLTS